ncbi:MAG TPA: polysaccharide deacetylase family protein [Gemmatimonadaceae bacterium]|jgi:peptidoglycan-N-acetylglucosamine deacetylase|nr:polysaccharide deacetylase family protein [Gemmatimonadaceae bacterium]
MTSSPRLASVSMDLDNVWSYLKTHGDAGWELRPSYLATFVPYVLDLLAQEQLQITFFVVGADAVIPEHGPSLKSLVQHGHEVGNHSFEHNPWMARYDRSRMEDEIARTEAAILASTGRRPIGFRGPGYAWSGELLEILSERGYLYDASTLPTYLGPLARAYYFRTTKLSEAERNERAQLFGRFADGLRPASAYSWKLPNGRTLLELPVTTFPVIKVPFHLSYLMYISRFSERLMVAYLGAALLACRLAGTEPSFLLHPLDLIDAKQEPRLAFFPGMDVPARRKAELFRRAVRMLREHFTIVNMSAHARSLLARNNLSVHSSVASGPVVSVQR